jgi:hypothetical protein
VSPPVEIKELSRGYDRHTLTPAGRVVPQVAGDEAFSTATQGNLEKHLIIGVGEAQAEGGRCDERAGRADVCKEVSDQSTAGREFRPDEDLGVSNNPLSE